MRLKFRAAAAFVVLASFAAAPALAQQTESAGAPVTHEAAGGSDPEGSGGHHLREPRGGWSFAGATGVHDRAAMQRGYRVYKEVCSSCHGMKLISFRNLGQPNAPFYDERFPNPNDNPLVKKIAAEYLMPAIDSETGDAITQPGKASDRFPSPYANEAAARGANGGALPPDLSVISKARHGGASYVYSLLMGFHEPPAGLKVNPGQHYNVYFPGDTKAQWSGDPRRAPQGGFLAMAPPLTKAGLVEYEDGTPATIDQMAQDVATFLDWASDPKAETRKQMGLAVIAYLGILALLVYISYRNIWRKVEH